MPVAKVDKNEAIARIAELFRVHGYHGTSYAQIMEVSGLGKGSLYHYFPNGKEDIAKAVLKHIYSWFEQYIFMPLEAPNAPFQTLEEMFDNVEKYFASGKRVCLIGAFALADTKDCFAKEITQYFEHWIRSLSSFLRSHGASRNEARQLATSVMVTIQGGLVLTHALGKTQIFFKILKEEKTKLRHALETKLKVAVKI